ncbi:DUF1850 domain-containing protein [Haloechinothrix sp. LS1_15]|nr:DUF1850 domain-containing protein [Haloechinothrix sp. LS1_15]
MGDELRLRHTHSVHRRPVVEVFSVSRSWELAMEEMRFDRMGANLPSGPETIGGVRTTFLAEGDGYRVLHHGRVLGTVELMVGSATVDHVLTAPGGQRVRLLDVAPSGTRVELRIGPAPGSVTAG